MNSLLAPSVTYYDKGSTFRQKQNLNDGLPRPEIVGMPVLFRKKNVFLDTWDMGLFIGMQFGLCRSQYSGEVWSSFSDEPQTNRGEPLS